MDPEEHRGYSGTARDLLSKSGKCSQAAQLYREYKKMDVYIDLRHGFVLYQFASVIPFSAEYHHTLCRLSLLTWVLHRV
jgi:hypothetical protein